MNFKVGISKTWFSNLSLIYENTPYQMNQCRANCQCPGGNCQMNSCQANCQCPGGNCQGGPPFAAANDIEGEYDFEEGSYDDEDEDEDWDADVVSTHA